MRLPMGHTAIGLATYKHLNKEEKNGGLYQI